MKPSHLVLLLLGLLSAPAAARTDTDESVWANLTVMGSARGRLVYFAEVQPRVGQGVSRFDTLILRGAAGWQFSPALAAYAGYAHIASPIENGRDRNEERLFLQLSWTLGPAAGGMVSSRSRLEHRRRSDGDDVGWRLREMVRYVRPLGRPERTRALLYLEGFVALDDTDWGARRGFDQLRSFAGVEVPLRGRSTLELGYLNQLVNQPAGNRRVNHVASVALFIRP